MNGSFVLLVLFILGVIVYTGHRVRRLMRKSEEQWKQVDRSKLRPWDDD